MAALDDSLTNFQGQQWSIWADRLGTNSPTSDSEDEENAKSKRVSTTTRLSKEEMAIYGYCPRWEDFYLVVCDVCGLSIKPQALKAHIQHRHGGVMTPVKSSEGTKASASSGSKSSKSRNRSSSTNPVVKLERRIDSRSLVVDKPSSQVSGESSRSSSSSKSNSTSSNTAQHCISSNSSNSVAYRVSALPGLPRSPITDTQPSPKSHSNIDFATSHSPYIKTEVKTDIKSESIKEDKTDIKMEVKMEVKKEEPLDTGGLDLLHSPPPQPIPISLPPPAPPESPHVNRPQHSPLPGLPGLPGLPAGSGLGTPHSLPSPVGTPQNMVSPTYVGSSVNLPNNSMNISCNSVNVPISSVNLISNSVNISSDSVNHSNNSVSLSNNSVAGLLMGQNSSSVEEEVNKISAMLQAEAEALTSSQNLVLPPSLGSGMVGGGHDIVEAQGLASGGGGGSGGAAGPNSGTANLTSGAGSGGIISSSPSLGSVQMSIATLNQIQAELLATVSESDLNAVLNATPEAADLSQVVLPNNSQCYISDGGTMQFIDQTNVNSDTFVEPPHLSNQNVIPQQYNNDQLSMPVLEQITNEVLAEADAHSLTGVGVQPIYTTSSNGDIIEVPVETFSFDEIEKISSHQCDELTNAVKSITQLCHNSNSSGLESHLADLLQQPHSHSPPDHPLPSPGAVAVASSFATGNSLGVAALAGSTMPTQATQGITVVIGAPGSGHSSILPSSTMPSLMSGMGMQHTFQGKKPPSVTTTTSLPTHIMSPGTVTTSAYTPSHTPTHTPEAASGHHTPTHPASQSIAPPTPSPNKKNKKRKPGERKLLPLKDREYDPEVHCGVMVVETGKPCTRSLTCKTHSLSLRRAVIGRSKKFDDLLLDHRAAKEAQIKASRPPELSGTTGLIQSVNVGSTPPRQSSQVSFQSSGSSSSSSGFSLVGVGVTGAGAVVGGAAATSPLLAKSLGVTVTAPTVALSVPQSEPSPSSLTHHYHHPYFQHPMDPPHGSQPPSSPHPWLTNTFKVAPALTPADNFYVREPPKPLATCSYNSRRLGGYLASDHRTDLLRSAFRNALKKPHTTGSILSDSSFSNSVNMSGTQDRYMSVKPLLARKLQLTVPQGSGTTKDGITVSTGYNGHIQLQGNNMGLMNNSALATAALKRPTTQQHENINKNSATTPIKSAKNVNKKVKTSDGAINIVGLQLDASGNKNHIPVVAVSLQNGLSNTQTITLSSVQIAGVRNSTTTPIRINPSTTSTFVRDSLPQQSQQIVTAEARPGGSDNANIVLGSQIPGGGGIMISEALAKSFKSDGAGGIRLELHSNTFGDATRLVTNAAKVGSSGGVSNSVLSSVSGAVGVSSGSGGSGITTATTPQLTSGGQLTYLTSAVPGTGAQLTLQQVQQVINRLQGQGKVNTGGVASLKLGGRSAFVLQQEKEPS